MVSGKSYTANSAARVTGDLMWRVVDIASEDQHLAFADNSLSVRQEGEEIGRLHLSDVNAIVVHSHNATLSKALIAACAEQDIPITYCNRQHVPVSLSLPVASHHRLTRHATLQASTSLAVKGRLWKQIIKRKITEQARSLEGIDEDAVASLKKLAKDVRSGDVDNREARAARIYWKRLLGPNFSRDRERPGLNAHLNYAYTILRSAMARAVVSAGLVPALGLHHKNQLNSFCLVDDLLEPYRPLADRLVQRHRAQFDGSLSREAKTLFADLVNAPITMEGENTSLQNIMNRTARSLIDILDGNSRDLTFPPAIRIESQYDLGI